MCMCMCTTLTPVRCEWPRRQDVLGSIGLASFFFFMLQERQAGFSALGHHPSSGRRWGSFGGHSGVRGVPMGRPRPAGSQDRVSGTCSVLGCARKVIFARPGDLCFFSFFFSTSLPVSDTLQFFFSDRAGRRARVPSALRGPACSLLTVSRSSQLYAEVKRANLECICGGGRECFTAV